MRRSADAGRLRGRPLEVIVCAVAAVLALVPGHAAAAVPDDSVGIYSEELERANSVDPAGTAQAQRRAGIGLVRQPFSWARIETAPGRLDYSVYDGVMTAAATAGVAVLPVLMDPPPWRSAAPLDDPGGDMYPPRDPDELAVLAGLLVQRYGPGGRFWASHPDLAPAPIRSWQVWNEPNLPDYWATGPDPAAYARLLGAVGSAIHAADPAAEVVAAGLPSSTRGMPLADYVDGLYAAGARGTFDTLAIHPYARDAGGVLDLLRTVRRQLDRLGDRERPIWATEFGWATGGPRSPFTTSEAGQATLLHDAITGMRQARDALVLRGFVVFRWRDVRLNAGQRDSWPLNTGLVRENGSPKPAFDVFRDDVALWRARSPAGGAPAATGTTSGQSSPQAPATGASAGPGGGARSLRIRRFVQRRRLVVSVAVSPGGHGAPVQISYRALRGARIVVHRTRAVRTRKLVARTIFKLPRSARSASLLRINAAQGTARATRDLRMRPKRRVSRPSAG